MRTRGDPSNVLGEKFLTEPPAVSSPTERPFSCTEEKPAKLTRDDSDN